MTHQFSNELRLRVCDVPIRNSARHSVQAYTVSVSLRVYSCLLQITCFAYYKIVCTLYWNATLICWITFIFTYHRLWMRTYNFMLKVEYKQKNGNTHFQSNLNHFRLRVMFLLILLVTDFMLFINVSIRSVTKEYCNSFSYFYISGIQNELSCVCTRVCVHVWI